MGYISTFPLLLKIKSTLEAVRKKNKQKYCQLLICLSESVFKFILELPLPVKTENQVLFKYF